MRQHIYLISTFYRSFGIYTAAISIGTWFFLGSPLNLSFFTLLPILIIFKLFVNALVWYRIRNQYPHRMYFYANRGISETRLFVTAFLLDFAVFFIFIAFAHLLMAGYICCL